MMSPHSTETGRFISFEGMDGAGKTSHLEAVIQSLKDRGLEVVKTREPGGTPLAEKIRNMVLHEEMPTKAELLLMYAARIDHVSSVIQPALKKGAWVVSDRFEDSSFAYQGFAAQLGEAECQTVSQWALGGFSPDLTFVFDLTVEQSLQRIQNRGEASDKFEAKPIEYLQRVRDGFLARAERFPERICVVDSSASEDDVRKQVMSQLHQFLEKIDERGSV